ncbi:hypothetical protein BDZ94DRAFT_1326102 [Collybia nuda]|uniref:Uncharacterized protein n=1 Tax=Collybia nuda TaxID=64659 RepID=A0A9P6CE59_9AGAR|nr:hypothetical protein BDZ94DRAFT_1326102 [Collybia nuda]
MSTAHQDITDPAILATLGTSLMASCVQTVTFTLMFPPGIFVLLFAQFTVTYMRRHKPSNAEYLMFLTSAFTFVLATVHEASLLATSGIFINSFLVGYQHVPLIERGPLVYEHLRTPNIIFSWMASFEVFISDGVVVWRAYVLLQHKRWFVIIPSFLLLSSFALALTFLVVLTIGVDREHVWIKYLLGTSLTLSLATNVASTAIIGYVYWIHRSGSRVRNRHQPTWPERVLFQLVESGVVFCILQAANIGIQSTISRGLVATIFASIYYGFSAMYPTMVIFLVNSQRTPGDVYPSEASRTPSGRFQGSPHTNTLRFSPADPTTSTLILPQRIKEAPESEKDPSLSLLRIKIPHKM